MHAPRKPNCKTAREQVIVGNEDLVRAPTRRRRWGCRRGALRWRAALNVLKHAGWRRLTEHPGRGSHCLDRLQWPSLR